MSVLRDVALVVGGLVPVLLALDSAVRTFVLPRGVAVPLTRIVSVSVRAAFGVRARFARTYEARDRVMALYAPLAMLGLVVTWLALVLGGFTLIFWVVEGDGWGRALITSGSSLFTLGFDRPPGTLGGVAAFAEAGIGLGLLALLIAYLPTIYGAFSRREVLVARMTAWAGEPPSALEMLVRLHRISKMTDLDDIWEAWQVWFAEVEETHTSLAFVNFFRSPDPHRSWVTAAGAALDAAAFVNSTVDTPWQPQAGLTVRGGFTALRSIADFFRIPYDPDPRPDDPISIARDEWEEACAAMAGAGVPLKPDREQAWRDFAGWRVNYDAVLLGLAGLVMAPYAPWSSDRSLPYRRPPLRRRSRS